MYLIVIAWLYVTVMMAVAEASDPQGSLLGASITFLLYGLLPVALLVYILGTPERKRRLKAHRERALQTYEAEKTATTSSDTLRAPDAGSHASGTAQDGGIPPVGKE